MSAQFRAISGTVRRQKGDAPGEGGQADPTNRCRECCERKPDAQDVQAYADAIIPVFASNMRLKTLDVAAPICW